MAKKEDNKSKRQIVREQREKRQRQQRLITILIVSGAAIIIAGLLIAPSIRNALTPVGDIVTVTPEARPLADGTALGDANAPVLVEVWEDFQCPSCRQYTTDIEPLVIQNLVVPGTVRYEFRQYPFIDDRSTTKESDQAANASLCANEQGKFWEYHDYLFANWTGENVGSFTDKRLVAFAEALGLNMDEFNQCFSAHRYQNVINQDIADGTQAGVTGTPSVFVNGQIVRPGYIPTYDDIAQAVSAAVGSN